MHSNKVIDFLWHQVTVGAKIKQTHNVAALFLHLMQISGKTLGKISCLCMYIQKLTVSGHLDPMSKFIYIIALCMF